MSRPMTGRAEGEPTEMPDGYGWCDDVDEQGRTVYEAYAPDSPELEHQFVSMEEMAAACWAHLRRISAPLLPEPPSDPSAGEGPPLRVLEEAIAEGRSEVTRDNAEIAALRDRVRALEAAGHRLLIVLTPAFVGTDARSDTVADFRRALTSGAPEPGDGGEP